MSNWNLKNKEKNWTPKRPEEDKQEKKQNETVK